MARRSYRAYRESLESPRWQKLASAGARPQRLLWASTGTKDPNASDVLYVEALAAPDTINTIPEKTLHAFADHGRVKNALDDGDDGAGTLAQFESAGIDLAAVGDKLQSDGVASFIKSWRELHRRIADRGAQLTAPAAH